MRGLLRRAWYVIRQRRLGDELAEEMDVHRALAQCDLEGRGVDPAEAAVAARRAFGSAALANDQSRDVWIPRALQGLGQDLRLAVRALAANRLVSAVAIASLALGIGANTAIFSLVNGLLLRPLPVSAPQRLALLSGGLGPASGWPFAVWREVQDRANAFDGAIAWSSPRFNLSERGEMQPANGMFVNGDYFTRLGVRPIIGRSFTAADDVRGGGADGPVAVIGYGFWQRRFGGAASAVGSTLMVERVPYTVIGVTPPDFYGTEVGRSFEVAVPIGTESLIHRNSALDDKSNYWLSIALYLKPAQSLDAANAILRSAQPQVRAAATPPGLVPRFQEAILKDPFTLERAAAGVSPLRQRYQRPLLALLVVVGLVLLIACANIANLQFARTTARRHELSVRVAIGASRWRVARALLAESTLVSVVGAALGMAIASRASRFLITQLSTTFNTVELDVSPDWRVLTFTVIVALTATVLFGVAPALRASSVAPGDALKDTLRSHTDGAGGRVAAGLIVMQVALSLVLLVSAGLFVRTFARLAVRPLGFDTGRVAVVSVNAGRAHVDAANRIPFYYRLADALAAVPGVARAAASVVSPISSAGITNFVDVPGAPSMAETDRVAFVNFVTPGWFATYGTPIRSGRDVAARDSKSAMQVLLVNEAFARKFFQDREPVGKTVRFVTGRANEVAAPKTVIGVVADAVYRTIRDVPTPTVYVPLAQWSFPMPMTGITIGVRSTSDSPAELAHALGAALTHVDPELTFNVRPLADQLSASLTQERVVAVLSGAFGLLALLLAGLGLFGVTAYAVSRRRREIGIRMALGAAPVGVVRLVLSQVTALVGAGLVIGVAVSLWASRFVASLLYGLEPRDPATLIGAVVVLCAVGVLAAWLPARRAAGVDPAMVLRCE
jgi:putative ABC transport system permease protein